MEKTEYIATLLQKCNNRKFETYAVSRLWYLLNDDRVKLVTQQCIYLEKDNGNDKGKYALADIYLPQINMVIEVDEAHHLDQKEADAYREQGIIESIGADIQRIDCTSKTDNDINSQIERLVDLIKNSVQDKEKLNLFVPWDCEMEQTATYHIKKEYLSVLECDYVKDTTEAFRIFNIKPRQCSIANVPGTNHMAVWCPYEDGSEWKNTLSNNGVTLTEEYIGKGNKSPQKPKDEQKIRIVFLKGKDSLGLNVARFVGIFKFIELKKTGKAIWVRVSYYCDLRNIFLYDKIN